MKFDIKIDLEKVILIGSRGDFKINYCSEIETKWVLIKGIENKIFCLNESELENPNEFTRNIINSEYQVVDLAKRIRYKIKDIVDKEFNKLFNQNKDYVLDYEDHIKRNNNGRKIGISREYKMLDRASYFGKNIRDDEYRTRYMNFGISEINKGIIYPLENENLRYDLLQDKFAYSNYTILNSIYDSMEIKQIIDYEQYRKGLTPSIYNEIAKINKFIKDKNTVRVELKNGTEFKTDAILRNIIEIYCNGEIYVANSYYKKITKGEDFDNRQYKADQIKCIKFGKQVLEITGENLTNLSRKIEEKNQELNEEEETEEM